MTEKVVIGNATLYRGDCMEVLADLQDTCDALITDPPYSSGGQFRGDRANGTVAKYVQSGPAEQAEHNVDFTGDTMDQRAWTWWMGQWMSLARDRMRAGAYAICFTDWRQLPSVTDLFQAHGFVWRGMVPWDKTEASRAPHTGYFGTSANTSYGARMARARRRSTAARGRAFCASAWTIARSCT